MKNTKTTIRRNLALAACASGLLGFTGAANADEAPRTLWADVSITNASTFTDDRSDLNAKLTVSAMEVESYNHKSRGSTETVQLARGETKHLFVCVDNVANTYVLVKLPGLIDAKALFFIAPIGIMLPELT